MVILGSKDGLTRQKLLLLAEIEDKERRVGDFKLEAEITKGVVDKDSMDHVDDKVLLAVQVEVSSKEQKTQVRLSGEGTRLQI